MCLDVTLDRLTNKEKVTDVKHDLIFHLYLLILSFIKFWETDGLRIWSEMQTIKY